MCCVTVRFSTSSMFYTLLFGDVLPGDGWDEYLGLGSYTIITRLKPEGSILKLSVNPK